MVEKAKVVLTFLWALARAIAAAVRISSRCAYRFPVPVHLAELDEDGYNIGLRWDCLGCKRPMLFHYDAVFDRWHCCRCGYPITSETIISEKRKERDRAVPVEMANED